MTFDGDSFATGYGEPEAKYALRMVCTNTLSKFDICKYPGVQGHLVAG